MFLSGNSSFRVGIRSFPQFVRRLVSSDLGKLLFTSTNLCVPFSRLNRRRFRPRLNPSRLTGLTLCRGPLVSDHPIGTIHP